MPLTCASFWLTFAVCPKNLIAGALGTMRTRVMESEHTLSSMSASVPANVTNKKVKRQRGSMVSTQHMENSIIKEKSIQSDVLKVQTIRDDPSRLEKMSVQELRATMRSLGIPARGCKSDLISSLKCFVADEKDVCSSQSSQSIEEHASFAMKPDHSESTLSKQEAKNSSVEVKAENMNFISEELEFHTHKRQGKLPSIDSQDVESNSKISTKKQNCSKKIDEATVMILAKKSSQAKRKVSSRLDNDDDGATHGISLATNLSEPWTVLTHKKPQQSWVPYNPRTMRPPPLTSDKISMKIMSWNVNGIRALLKLEAFSALELAKREDFDVLCLQETKLQEKDVEAMKQSLIDGYGNSFWTCSISKLGYSGTAIISRIKPLSVKYGLGVPDHDSEGRLLTVEFDRFYLLSGYVPNSGDGLKRLNYRVTQWDPSLGCYMKELEKSKPVILTGDLNCAHQEIDIFNPAGNKRSAGFTDEERESFEVNFLSRGFVDTFRQKHPGVVGYTYWGYRHNCRKSNKGWRLDYFLVSESIAEKVHDSYILPDVNGSDHCPIGLILKH